MTRLLYLVLCFTIWAGGQDRPNPNKILRERLRVAVPDGDKASPQDCKMITDIIRRSQIQDFEFYRNPKSFNVKKLDELWAPSPAPERGVLQGKVVKLQSHPKPRHYATAACITLDDLAYAEATIKTRVPHLKPIDMFNHLAGYKGLASRQDWTICDAYKRLLESQNISLDVDPESLRVSRDGIHGYGEAVERWYWIVHEQPHVPIGGNAVEWRIPYTLIKVNGKWLLEASGTPTANSVRSLFKR